MKAFFKVVGCFIVVMALGWLVLELSKPELDSGPGGVPSPEYTFTQSQLDALVAESFAEGWRSSQYFRDKYGEGEVIINVADLNLYEKRSLRDYLRAKALAYLYRCDSLYYLGTVARSNVASSPSLPDIARAVQQSANTESLRNTPFRRRYDARHALHDEVHTFIHSGWSPAARGSYSLDPATGQLIYTLGSFDFASYQNSKENARRALAERLNGDNLLRRVDWMTGNINDAGFVARKINEARAAYNNAEVRRLTNFLNSNLSDGRLRNMSVQQLQTLRGSLERLGNALNGYPWKGNVSSALVQANGRVNDAISHSQTAQQ